MTEDRAAWRLVGTERVPVEPVYAEAMPARPLPTEWVTRYQWEMKVSAMTETPEPPKTEDRAALVGFDYCPDIRIAVTDGNGGVKFSINGTGAPAGISLYHEAYVASLRDEISDIEREVSALERQRNAAEKREQAAEQRAEAAMGLLTECRKALACEDAYHPFSALRRRIDAFIAFIAGGAAEAVTTTTTKGTNDGN